MMATTLNRESRSKASSSTTETRKVVPKPVRVSRLPRAALGLIVALVGAVVGYTLFANYNDRASVVVVVAPVDAGEIVTRDDVALSDAALGNGISAALSDIDGVVGNVAVHDLSAGQIVFADDLASEGLVPLNGQVVLGVVLEPGGYPVNNMRSGAVVDIFVPTDPLSAPALSEGNDEQDSNDEADSLIAVGPLLEGVVVQSVEEVSRDGRAVLVSLIVDQADASVIINNQPKGLHLAIQSDAG